MKQRKAFLNCWYREWNGSDCVWSTTLSTYDWQGKEIVLFESEMGLLQDVKDLAVSWAADHDIFILEGMGT